MAGSMHASGFRQSMAINAPIRTAPAIVASGLLRVTPSSPPAKDFAFAVAVDAAFPAFSAALPSKSLTCSVAFEARSAADFAGRPQIAHRPCANRRAPPFAVPSS
jgi:hypothetical protein